MLAKLKELVKGIIQYLIDNPIQRTILVAVGVAVVALIITLIVVGATKKKKKKAAAKAAEAAAQQAEVVAEDESQPEAQEAEVKEVETAEETAEEAPAPAEEVAEETPAPVQETPAEEVAVAAQPEPEKTEKPKAKKPAAKKAKTETAAKEKASPAKKEAKPTPVKEEAQPAPAKETAAEPTAKKPAAKAAKTEKAEAKPDTTAAKQPEQKATKYPGKWVVYKLVLTDAQDNAIEEDYFFELRASNGEKLLTSEEYSSYAGALKGIQTHKDNVEKGNFRITLSKKGDYIFKLLTAKNTLLCTGANYKSMERCESAIASTKRFAATAVLQEKMEELRIQQPVEDEPTPISVPDNGYTGKWIIYTKGNAEVGTMYYFELLASNGEKLLTSEEYTTYEGTVNAVATHKANIAKGNFRITITKRGDYLFKLLGGNGQLLCLGEHYKTRSRCESAVESVKRFSQSAPVYKYGEING